MTDEQILQETIRRICESFEPAKVILFGSRARGETGEGADFDFVVLFERVDDVHARSAQIRLALRDLPGRMTD